MSYRKTGPTLSSLFTHGDCDEMMILMLYLKSLFCSVGSGVHGPVPMPNPAPGIGQLFNKYVSNKLIE